MTNALKMRVFRATLVAGVSVMAISSASAQSVNFQPLNVGFNPSVLCVNAFTGNVFYGSSGACGANNGAPTSVGVTNATGDTATLTGDVGNSFAGLVATDGLNPAQVTRVTAVGVGVTDGTSVSSQSAIQGAYTGGNTNITVIGSDGVFSQDGTIQQGGFATFNQTTGNAVSITPDTGLQIGNVNNTNLVSASIDPNGNIKTVGTLSVGGATTTNGITNTGAIITDTVTVNGATTLKGLTTTNGINNTGAITTNTITSTGVATVGALKSNGGATIVGNTTTDTLTVKGAATVAGPLTVSGKTKVNDFAVTNGSTVNLGDNVVSGVADPIAATDAANKRYVDNADAILNRKIRDVRDGVAIALSIQNPDLVSGERFGVSVNWGSYDGSNSLGIAAQGVIGKNIFGAGERVAITGGVGFSTERSNVAGRAGVQFTW